MDMPSPQVPGPGSSPTGPATSPEGGRPGFRDAILGPGFPIGVEMVTTRGEASCAAVQGAIALGAALADDPRVGWFSFTDNPGGSPMLPADVLGRKMLARRIPVVIHLTCKDLNRNGLESAAWRYAAEDFHSILALTGDLPAAGHGGQAPGVFDLDSVALVALLSAMRDGLETTDRRGKTRQLDPVPFFIGAAASPFKRHEREYMPQLFKLARKLRCGADWIIPQLGYDMRKFQELDLFLQWSRTPRPLIGNVYILNKVVAQLFHENQIAGCVVSDELLQQVNKYAGGEDRGRAFFIELAAKQLACFRGMGWAAGYLAGSQKPETYVAVLDKLDTFAEDDWKQFAREIQYPQQDEFYLFERDDQTGLSAPGQLNPTYVESLARPPKTGEAGVGYKLSRAVHKAAFTPGHGLFPTMQKLYRSLEKDGREGDSLAIRSLHVIERAGKEMMFGCRDCGDCSLPDCAYLCPSASCSKKGRNGPCGGSFDGTCEAGDKQCLWARAYDRLKAYGETEHMLDGPAIFTDAGLDHTSSWANTYLERDHHAAQRRAEDAPAEAPPGPEGDRPDPAPTPADTRPNAAPEAPQ